MPRLRSFATLVALGIALPIATAGAQRRAKHPVRRAPRVQMSPAARDSATAREVNALADSYVAGWFAYRPEDATLNGAPYGDAGAIVDNSIAALRTWRATEDRLLKRVEAMDPKRLGDRPERVTYGMLRETLTDAVRVRICHNELWLVSPGPNGWLATYTEVADVQPVGSATARADAVRRIRALPRYLDTEVANLRTGLGRGYSAPQVLVRGVIAQVDGLLAAVPAASPLAAAAARDSTAGFRDSLAAVIGASVYPALRRYRDFLEHEYQPHARETIAVTALPNGLACYRSSARQASTLELAPDSVHRLGLAQGARIEAEMREIAVRDFGTSDVPALLHRLRTDSAFTFRTRQEIRDTARAAIGRAQAAVPRWFGIVPKAGVSIRDYPEFRQVAGAIGEAAPPGADGAPATFFINTYDPAHKPRASFEALAFHEGVPGHGLQLSIAAERGTAHPMTRYFFTSGYGEGWALYAEGLAEEMGIYGSSLGRLGMRASQSARAARLVVDPAIHTMGWSRAQAVEYMKAHTTWDDRLIEAEVDRYIAWPGQATSYMLGQLEILRLRQAAKDALGDRFDIRAFHDQVLGSGNVTLPLLRETVERWIAAQRPR